MQKKGQIRIINKKTEYEPPGAVDIARPAILGNPFVIGVHGTREEVIRKYEKWLDEKLKDRDSPQRREMVGLWRRYKNGEIIYLSCWCWPEPCHGEIIKKIIEGN